MLYLRYLYFFVHSGVHIVLCIVCLHPCGLFSHIHDSAQHGLLEISIIEIHSS